MVPLAQAEAAWVSSRALDMGSLECKLLVILMGISLGSAACTSRWRRATGRMLGSMQYYLSLLVKEMFLSVYECSGAGLLGGSYVLAPSLLYPTCSYAEQGAPRPAP